MRDAWGVRVIDYGPRTASSAARIIDVEDFSPVDECGITADPKHTTIQQRSGGVLWMLCGQRAGGDPCAYRAGADVEHFSDRLHARAASYQHAAITGQHGGGMCATGRG